MPRLFFLGDTTMPCITSKELEEMMEKFMGPSGRPGVFNDHNCWKCQDGKLPCIVGNPRNCEYLHARND